MSIQAELLSVTQNEGTQAISGALSLAARLTAHADDRSVINSHVIAMQDSSGEQETQFDGARWVIRWTSVERVGSDEIDLEVTFEITEGQAKATSVGVDFIPLGWGVNRYVVMPGAVYAGNRFESRVQPYPPMFQAGDARIDTPILISDVARLSYATGETSRLKLPSHDLTTPAVGVFDPEAKTGLWLLTQQRSRFGPYGISIDESSDRASAMIGISAPCVREGRRSWAAWSDRAPDWDASAANRLITVPIKIVRFACNDVIQLFERFSTLRNTMVPAIEEFTCAPLAACADILETKFNTSNWCESAGCFASKEPEVDWQLGWVNGLVTSYGLLVCGGEQSRKRAMSTLDFALASQMPSGLLPGYFRKQSGWIGDGFERPGTKDWAMVRKQADALYFGVKHLIHLEATDQSSGIKPQWKSAIAALADALVSIWASHGEFGQFVDVQTGKLVVGNSTAGGLIPAALALAGDYLGRPDLIQAACVSADSYYERWTARGLTVGGPGEILATPDSESAAALLESFITLFEITRNRQWLSKASAAADQLASWVVSYRFEFPPESDLGRLHANATGTVVANAQNKHSAPGLCTFSGDSLLRLFRATGERRHIMLLHDIAGTFPQYMSRADHVVGTSPPGVICERVNLSDWEGDHRVGSVPPWPCWSESALMLTCADVPGVYVQPDMEVVVTLDNIQALKLQSSSTKIAALLINRTPLDASVRVFSESAANARGDRFSPALVRKRTTTVKIPSGGAVSVEFSKSDSVAVLTSTIAQV